MLPEICHCWDSVCSVAALLALVAHCGCPEAAPRGCRSRDLISLSLHLSQAGLQRLRTARSRASAQPVWRDLVCIATHGSSRHVIA